MKPIIDELKLRVACMSVVVAVTSEWPDSGRDLSRYINFVADERMRLYELSLTNAAELAELRRQLAEAEEARERAYDNRDMALQAADHDKARADAAETKLAEAEAELQATRDDRETYAIQRDAAEAKLALAEQDSKRLDFVLWRSLSNRAAIDAALAAGEGE